MLSYLIKRLCKAQGFTAYLAYDPSRPSGPTSDPDLLIADARRRCKGTKGACTTIKVHRYYGKHPQERSSTLWVEIPVRYQQGEGLVLDTRDDITVQTPDYTQPYKWGQPTPMAVTHIPITRPYATWNAILVALAAIREPKMRRTA